MKGWWDYAVADELHQLAGDTAQGNGLDMDQALEKAYKSLQTDITAAMQAHRGNKSLMSVMLNTLLLYPDHPYGIGPIFGKAYDP